MSIYREQCGQMAKYFDGRKIIQAHKKWAVAVMFIFRILAHTVLFNSQKDFNTSA
jgi:hypothetical protein